MSGKSKFNVFQKFQNFSSKNKSFLEDDSEKDKDKDIFCTNCQKYGHINKRCHSPMESYGIVATQFENPLCLFLWLLKQNKLEYFLPDSIKILEKWEDIILDSSLKNTLEKYQLLMIRRKHSFSYVSWIRGKYNMFDIPYITYMFQTMSQKEIDNILHMEFETAWRDLWSTSSSLSLEQLMEHTEYLPSKKKWDQWKNGFLLGQNGYQENYNLNDWIKFVRKYPVESNDIIEPEWGFPKGRRDFQENYLITAKREFNEETNLLSDDLYLYADIMQNVQTKFEFLEDYYGSDQIHYKLHYYPALYINKNQFELWIEKNIKNIQNILKNKVMDLNKIQEWNQWIPNSLLEPSKGEESRLEISQINWFSWEDGLKKIRFYDCFKRSLYFYIGRVISKFHSL